MNTYSLLDRRLRGAMASPLLNLPGEILVEVLSCLPDASSLYSVVRACRYLYTFVNRHRDFIINPIVTTLVCPQLLPQSLAVLESTHIRHWTDENVTKVLSHYHRKRRILRSMLSLRECLGIEMVFRKVCLWTDSFISLNLSKRPITEGPKVCSPIASDEWFRIASSFYRYELCVQIFRQHVSPCYDCRFAARKEGPEMASVLLNHFSLCDIEKLGCVAEFLSGTEYADGSKSDSHFDSVADWGVSSMDMTDIYTWSNKKLELLRYGLQSLRLPHVVNDRAKDIYGAIVDKSSLYVSHRHWQLDSSWDNTDMIPTGHADPAPFVKVRLGSAIATDADPEPATAYSYVTEPSEGRDSVCTLDPFFVRARGYVMWNESRLNDWGVFKDFHPPTQSTDD